MVSKRWSLYPFITHQLCVRDFITHIFPIVHPMCKHILQKREERQEEGREGGRNKRKKEVRKKGRKEEECFSYICVDKPAIMGGDGCVVSFGF